MVAYLVRGSRWAPRGPQILGLRVCLRGTFYITRSNVSESGVYGPECGAKFEIEL